MTTSSTLDDIEIPDMDVASLTEASPIDTEPTPDVAVTSGSFKAQAPPPAKAVRRPSAVTSAPPVVAPRSSSKSKKKKGQTQVTMASAPSSGGGSAGGLGENTGRWTAEEHRLFLQGLEQHGKGWKKIASLIKSRTVVQIRTHAQKYFQKLAKARQNGEDEGAVTFMEGRGGVASVTSASTIVVAPRRRRQVTGTKRKAIQSVVSSAQRQGKKLAAAQAAAGVPNPMAPLPAVAPALAYFVLPASGAAASDDGIPPPGTISGPALEDSLFRFLTPCPPEDATDPQVNDVARLAGANPITLPTDNLSATVAGGENSPTGVNDISIYPAWADAKETPSWYAKGADVDALLDVADTLDWLLDTGDLNESYDPPPMDTVPSLSVMDDGEDSSEAEETMVKESTSVSTLHHVDTNLDAMVPTLPSLFQNESTDNFLSHGAPSTDNLKVSPSGASMLAHLQVFDTPMEEHAFVSTILEDITESSDCLPSLG